MQVNQFEFCCGVVEIGAWYGGYNCHRAVTASRENAFMVATFTNRSEQKRAYDALARDFKIVAQTEPVVNPNSGNLVFVVVYTRK